MKLKDFGKSDLFKKIRKDMGIPEGYNAEFKADIQFKKNEISQAVWKEIEIGKGLDIKLDEIEVADDNTLEYKGQKMILYIRDVGSWYAKGDSNPKFHISWCKTLENMNNSGRMDRYVVSRRKDGKFFVNIIDNKYNRNIIDEKLLKLDVCKNCLKKLKYNNYDSATEYYKAKIFEAFSIEDFLSKYNTKFKKKPKHTETTAPINQYPENWREISASYREYKNWVCEKCGKDFSENRAMLDTHHKNGNKSNCHYYNLEALCKNCHAEEPYHSHYRRINR